MFHRHLERVDVISAGWEVTHELFVFLFTLLGIFNGIKDGAAEVDDESSVVDEVVFLDLFLNGVRNIHDFIILRLVLLK